jgi:hypothetical protein
MAVKKLVFDIMLNGRFVCTLRMPITFDVVDDIDEMGGVTIRSDKLQQYIEEKRPNLVGKDYKICF